MPPTLSVQFEPESLLELLSTLPCRKIQYEQQMQNAFKNQIFPPPKIIKPAEKETASLKAFVFNV